jgi:hypothetical protein
MKKTKFIFLVLMLLFIFSCTERKNPLASREIINPVSHCYMFGLEIDFVDTCSYDFVTTFLSSFDSVTVTGTFLGGNFYVYADSGDYYYWYKYFENDFTVQMMTLASDSDSLILKITLSGTKSRIEEEQRFQQIKHLQILHIEEQPKFVYVDVPENAAEQWCEFFRQFSFISYVMIIGACTES